MWDYTKHEPWGATLETAPQTVPKEDLGYYLLSFLPFHSAKWDILFSCSIVIYHHLPLLPEGFLNFSQVTTNSSALIIELVLAVASVSPFFLDKDTGTPILPTAKEIIIKHNLWGLN
jgi:hypothetical protein